MDGSFFQSVLLSVSYSIDFLSDGFNSKPDKGALFTMLKGELPQRSDPASEVYGASLFPSQTKRANST